MEEEIQKPDIKIDDLKFAFIKARERLLSETDALQINLTNTFWSFIRDKIEHRELINIAVRGEVRTGKSTEVLKIVWEINKYMTKIGINPKAMSMMMKLIFSDQTEFLRFINSNERNVAIAIDEFNRMAATGLNATTEEALFDHYSDVFAGQYLHRVTASPDVITDKNSNIILDVIGKDEEKRIVRNKLIYRDIVTKQFMTIGRVDIYIGDIVENWIDNGVRDIVEKREGDTLEEKKKIEHYRKTDFYVRYQVKKYLRMDLMKKHGVRDIRDLEFADIILDVLNELQDFSKIQKVDQELVMITVDEVCRRHKRIYSILAKNEISQKVKAILGLNTKINQMSKKLRGGISTKPLLPDERLILEKTIRQAKDMLSKRVEEQEKLSKLYREYMEID